MKCHYEIWVKGKKNNNTKVYIKLNLLEAKGKRYPQPTQKVIEQGMARSMEICKRNS